MWPLFTYKVLLVGDAQVGKTSVLAHWARGELPSEPYNATVAPELLTKEVTLEGCIVRLQVLDIGFGDPYMTSLLPRYVGGANGVALMYDVANAATEEGVEHWYEQLRGLLGPTCVFVVAGCKGDLRQAAGIQEKAQAFARNIRAEHVVTSAQSGVNTGRIFEILAQELKRRGAVGGFGQAPAPPLPQQPQARVPQPQHEMPAQSPYAALVQPRAEYVPPAGNPSPMPARPSSGTTLQGTFVARGGGLAHDAHGGGVNQGYVQGGATAMPPKLVKLVLLGEPGVGKSSFAQRLAGSAELPFQDDYIPTAGPELLTRQIVINGALVKLQVWDAAAQDLMSDTAICNPVLKGADAAFILYDVTQRQSMDNLKKWMHLLETQAAPHVVAMLVGNKVDLKAHRALSEHQGQQTAQLWRVPFSEYSARRDADVTGLLGELLEPGRRPPHWPVGHDGQGQAQAGEPVQAPAPAAVEASPPASKPTWGAWASSFFTGSSSRVPAPPQPEEPPPTTEAPGLAAMPALPRTSDYPRSLPNVADVRGSSGVGAAPGGLYGGMAPVKEIEQPGAASTEVRGAPVGTTDAMMGPEPEPAPGPVSSDTSTIARQEYSAMLEAGLNNAGRSSSAAVDSSPRKNASFLLTGAGAAAQQQAGQTVAPAQPAINIGANSTEAPRHGTQYMQQVAPEEPGFGVASSGLSGPRRSPAPSPSPPSKPIEPSQADVLPRRLVSQTRMSNAGGAVQSAAAEATVPRGYQGQTQMPSQIPVGSPHQTALDRSQSALDRIQTTTDRIQAATQQQQQQSFPRREQPLASSTPASAAAAAAAAAKAAQEAAAMAAKVSPAVRSTVPAQREPTGVTGSPTARTVIPNFGLSGLQTTYDRPSAVPTDRRTSVAGSPPGSSSSLPAASAIMRGTTLNQQGWVVPQRQAVGAPVMAPSASATIPQRSPGEAMRTPGEPQRIPIQRTPGVPYRMPIQGAPDGPAAIRSSISQAAPAKMTGQQVVHR